MGSEPVCHCCLTIILPFTQRPPFCHSFINVTYCCLLITSSISMPLPLWAEEIFIGSSGFTRAFQWYAKRQRQMGRLCAWTVGPQIAGRNVRSQHRQYTEKSGISTCVSWLWSSAIRWTRKPGHIWDITPFNSDTQTTCQASLYDNG